MLNRRIYRPLDQNSALIRALDSLWASDTDVITQTVQAMCGKYSVQTGDDYDGYLYMLIEPTSENAKYLPSYLISGKTGRLELAAVCGDECQTLGCFAEIDGLVSDLTVRLLCGACGTS